MAKNEYKDLEKRKLYMKNYYEKKNNIKIECNCGLIILSGNMKSHLKSKKHELILLLLNK